MAWGEPEQLKIDEEAMAAAYTSYTDCASRMTTLRDKLKTSVDGIRDGWQSDGGTAFFAKFDEQWYANFTDYINVINHMANNMNTANASYAPLYKQADAIKLEVSEK